MWLIKNSDTYLEKKQNHIFNNLLIFNYLN